jgi:hypothetical protein
MKRSSAALPQSPSIASQMPIWWLASFLVAIGLSFVIERFVPSVVALAPGFGALPSLARNVLFVLVLTLLGVVIQAAWWVAHKRPSDQRI